MIFVIGEPVRFAGEERVRYAARLGVFGLAALAGATALGAALGKLGQILLPQRSPFVWATLALVGALVLIRETVARWVPIPQRRWQLPRSWLSSFWGGAAAFGSAMGAGVFTYSESALFHLYLVSCFVSGSTMLGMGLGAWYGSWFFGAVLYTTVVWRGGPTGSQATRALDLQRRVRGIGAAVAPLVVTLPGVWPGSISLF
jgi:hypothetical protein